MNVYQKDEIRCDQNMPFKLLTHVTNKYAGAGMQQYLCFFMPFFCGTAPLFFRLPPSASASLKLDSDPPSQDSSESKPEADTRAPITAGLRTKPQSCPN